MSLLINLVLAKQTVLKHRDTTQNTDVALFFSCSARCVYARPAGRMARRGQRYRRIRTSPRCRPPAHAPKRDNIPNVLQCVCPAIDQALVSRAGATAPAPTPAQPQPACDPQRMYTIYVSTYLMSLEAFCAGGLGPILVGGSIILYN
jgi:hypothetical protein